MREVSGKPRPGPGVTDTHGTSIGLRWRLEGFCCHTSTLSRAFHRLAQPMPNLKWACSTPHMAIYGKLTDASRALRALSFLLIIFCD